MSGSGKKKTKKGPSSPAGGTDFVDVEGSPNRPTAWLSASGLPPELLLESNGGDSSPIPVKKKRVETPIELEAAESTSSSPLTVTDTAAEGSTFTFKDKNFVHSSKGPGGGRRTRVWKTLKQIVANEKALPWGEEVVTYGSIDAPPSFKPAKKYSDLSGLPAHYTDPHTKLRYATSDEFARVRVLPSDIVAGYLALRKAQSIVP